MLTLTLPCSLLAAIVSDRIKQVSPTGTPNFVLNASMVTSHSVAAGTAKNLLMSASCDKSTVPVLQKEFCLFLVERKAAVTCTEIGHLRDLHA